MTKSQWISKLTYRIEHLAVRAGIFYHITSHYYRDVIKREIRLANITERDHVLCIGGGACPFSAILLHQTSSAKVTVIDNNSDCILKARQLVDRLGMNEHIRLLCQDGGSAELSLSEYSVVHFALQVSPAEHVFSQIKNRAAPGTKLLIRRPKKSLGKMYCALRSSIQDQCQKASHRTICNIGSTLLYVKQEDMAFCGSDDVDCAFSGSVAV